MGHITTKKQAYKNLEDRINWFTQGAPASPVLYQILQVLYTEQEARAVSRLPVRPFTIKRAALAWNTSEAKAEKMLDRLCEKALLVDSDHHGVRKFVMPPPMAGFIEFALMRIRGDIDQKYLSELYYQYMNVEEEFVKDLFFATETKLGRVYVQEPALELSSDDSIHILDYERAGHIVEDAEYVGIGMCYCRHKAMHAGHPCEIDAPMDVCMTFGNVARSLAEHGGHTRLVSKEEAMDVLALSYEHNLVQIGENVQESPAFICNCCGCCCEALQASRRFAPMVPVATTNYLPHINEEKCIGCGKCAKVCPILTIELKQKREGRGVAEINTDICLGCGVCVRNCPEKAIELKRREAQIITPVNSTARFVAQAIEKGTLQNLIFDNQAFASHRAMAGVFGAILKLPPVKQAMASKQFKSIYLNQLLARKKEKN